MHTVSSWFIDEIQKPSSSPKRTFTIGNSDYSSRVLKWPKIKKTSDKVASTGVRVSLDNTDGGLNLFFVSTYTTATSCSIKMGFTHPTSGDELLPLYTGNLFGVSYSKTKCNVKLQDILSDLGNRNISDTNSAVDFTSTIPSDIAWTLCTCYGGLSGITCDTNPHIDYSSFAGWSEQFSSESITMDAHYSGEKVFDAITRIANMTDSVIWTDGDGKIKFHRFAEMSSNFITVGEGCNKSIELDVEKTRLSNRVVVGFDYSVDSDYWEKTVTEIDSTSVDSFGTHELMLQDETIWYVSSVDALSLAARKITLLKEPPRVYKVKSDLSLMHAEIGDNIRLVDSFFQVDSSQGWCITTAEVDAYTGNTMYTLDEATVINAFYLDKSFLDGNDILL